MNQRKKKLGIVITDGVGFRNFILSDFIVESKKQFSEIIIFSYLPVTAYIEYNLDCKIVEIPAFQERFITWIFRRTKEIAHLQKFASDNYGIRDNLNLNRTQSNSIRGFTMKVILWVTTFLNSETSILLFEKLQAFTLRFYRNNAILKQILTENAVDLLFLTHQRPPFIAPLIVVSKSLKIKTVSFIFSWDNLASKGRMAGTFDYYLVWSELMKTELHYFYESIKSNRVKVVGTPQFEPYVLTRYEETKKSFTDRFNININIPTILFTCNDSSSKNDPIYAELLGQLIDEGIVNANLIIRTSPVEDPIRFLYLKEKYPFIIWNIPEWTQTRPNHPEPWTQRVPTSKDIITLRSLLNYSDIIINVLSTITLDAFLFNKPVINPIFGNNENGMFNDQRFLRYKHLFHLKESQASLMAKNRSELIKFIKDCLDKPASRLNEQNEFIDLEIGYPLEETSARIAKTLYQLD